MYCSKCGKKIDEGQMFCPYCGNSTGNNNGGSYNMSSSPNSMPKKGLYLTLMVFGFLLGVIWGALSVSHYREMNAAIARNDSVSAWEHAKKIRIFFWIGLVINVLLLIGQMAQV